MPVEARPHFVLKWALRGAAVGVAISVLYVPLGLELVLNAFRGVGGESADWGEPLFYMVLLGVQFGAFGCVVGAAAALIRMSQSSPPDVGSHTLAPPPSPLPASGAAPVGDRRLMLVLSYLGIFSLIPLITKKDDTEVRWHAKNGLALTIAWVITWAILSSTSFILRNTPGNGGVGCGLVVIAPVVQLAFLAADIVAMARAVGGQRFRIPLVTDIAEKM